MRLSLASTSAFLLLSSITEAAPLKAAPRTPEDCAYGTCLPRVQLTGTPADHPSLMKERIHIKIQIKESIRNFDHSIFPLLRHSFPGHNVPTHEPLNESYLQSLTRATQSLERKVANYLSQHRKTLTTKTSSHHVSGKPCRKQWVYLPGNVYVKTHEYVSRKPDVAIVGIVLMFFTLLVLTECVARVLQFARERRADRSGRGEIFLEEKDGEIRIVSQCISVVGYEDEKAALIRETEIEV